MTTRIMVIEDETPIRQLLYYQLSGAGYDLKCYPSGRAGLEHLLFDQPDLVLLDVMMPDMSGWETCRQIRAASNVPIIMLTSKDSDTDVVTGLSLGADDYITKPFNLMLLLARIDAVLRRRGPAERSYRPRQNDYVQNNRVEDPHLRYLNESYSAVSASQKLAATPLPAAASQPRPVKNSAGRLGDQLHQLRLARGTTLEQAAQACGIRWEFLQALEREHWSYLPKTELRQALQRYSTYLGLNLDSMRKPQRINPLQALAFNDIPFPLLLLLFFAIACIVMGVVLLF